MCTVAISGKVMCMYFGTVLDVIRVPIPDFQSIRYFIPKFCCYFFFAVVPTTAHIVMCEHYHTGNGELLVMYC
jgi:hypothetical protein